MCIRDRPYAPLSFSAIAGRNCYEFYDPERKSPIHNWHLNNGAIFEDVGQWKRPWYYPKKNETMEDAVNREVKATRDSLGILDASTLGKIDLKGRDVSEFLNRVYTNAWSKLAIGKCRYGVMLGDDGMVIDDGVTTRLGEHHYLMTTTTEPGNRQNRFATEPQVQVIEGEYFDNAERVNGQLAMLGFVAALGSYIITGQIIPGIF